MSSSQLVTATVMAVQGGDIWCPIPAGEPVGSAADARLYAFGSVTDAVRQAATLADSKASVGLAVGELTWSKGMWDGTVRRVAAALAERAQLGGGGRVIAVSIVSALTSVADIKWTPAGTVEVDADLIECVEALRGWKAAGSFLLPLPPLLALNEPFPFVARDEPWSELRKAWGAAAGGGRQLVLVSGEAGAGKTRLVTEFARSVHQQGAAVLFGSCTQHGSVPYEPFAAALAHLVERADQTLLQEVLPAENAELTRLIPTHTGSAPAPLADDPDAERFRLFAAMARALNTLAHHRPVLLALDDLHWGSHSSLQLLAYLVHVPGLARVCLVASYRSSPGDISEGLKVVLPELRRQRGVTPLVLRGLDREGVRRFVEGVTGQSDSTLHPVSDLLTAHTGGNAFLVGELWRHLVETGHVVRAGHQWRIERTLADVTSPESVRDVVKTRVDRLPTETAHLLGMAAVLGTHFAIGVLADAAQLDVRQVLQALEPALASGLLEEAGSGGLRFTHTLVRQAMVEALTPSARCNHHLRVARALEAHLSERAAPEIAHHLAAAVPLVAPAEAVAAARCAARLAMCSAAYDDAATYLAAVEPMVESNRHRAELLLELANARMRSGDVAAALAHCLESRQLAVRLAAPELIVAATLLYDDANWRGALHGGVSARLLEEALPLATDESTAVRLRASLGRAFALSGQSERGLAISEAALADAEGSGDYKAKQVAYSAVSFAMWTPQRLGRMLTLARRYVDEARGVGDLDSELGALGKLLYGKITAGELGDARAVRARYRAVARQLCQPLFLRLDYQAEVLFAVGEGRFVDAEVAALEADGLSRFLSANQAPGSIGVQMFSLRREQGRLEEARPVVEAIARSGQADRTWKPALALLYAELGEHDLAAEQLHELVRDRLAAIPRDSLWCGALGYLADACLMVGDQEAAPIIYRELLPWQGLVVQVGHLLAAHGAVDRFLGSLAELTGNDGDAKSYFEAALRLEDKCRMPVWSARTYLAYGRFLSRRRQKGDVEQARALLQTALDTANSHAMVKLTSEASDALASLSKVSSRGAAEIVRGLTQRELTILRQLATGRSNREIGERLHISQHTAANHVRAILLKTGCANRTEATAWAIRCGLAPE